MVLTNSQQILTLPPSEARQAKPVTLRGVVTHFHTQYGWFWMQDEAAPILVAPAERGIRYSPGQTVEVSGETDLGMSAPWIVRAKARVTGTAPLPPPLQPSPWRMAAGAHLGHRVVVEGMVRDASYSRDTLVLLVGTGGAHFRVLLPDGLAPLPTADWLEARVRATGIHWTDPDSAGRPGGFVVRLNGTNDLVVLAPGQADAFAREISPASAVERLASDRDTRVRVIGTVLARLPSGVVFLQDSTGALMVEPLAPLARADPAEKHLDLPPSISVRPGTQVEAVGTPARAVGFPMLEDALYRVIDPRKTSTLPEPVRASVSTLLKGGRTCELVTLRGRLLRREPIPMGRFLHESLLLQTGETFFTAVLETDGSRTLPLLQKDHLIEATGLVTVCPTGLQQERMIRLWLRGTNDVHDLGPAPREWSRTSKQFLGASLLAGAAALGWIWLLRRRVSQRTHELRQANLRLEDNEARLRTVLEHAPEAIMALDADTGRFIEVNENAVRLFGRPRAELLCLGPESLSPPTQPDGRRSADVAREKVGEALAGGAPVFEWTHRSAHGDLIPCEVRLARFPASGRNLAIGTVTDITDRKRAETETLKALAREKELSALKSNFVQIVSHEFRTPLGVILSSADLLAVYLDKLDERERRETLASIQKATRQMASLMENVLVLSKADAGKMDFEPTQINFEDFCRRLTDELLAATNHKCPIHFAVTRSNGQAWGDERLLRHIFLNLLSNAVKYSEEGRPVYFDLTSDVDNAVCQIRDQGLGIPLADQAGLFSAFHRGRNVENVAGTGLGLLIVKRCVELHGGRVACESNEGRGTTFTVWLPLYASQAPKATIP